MSVVKKLWHKLPHRYSWRIRHGYGTYAVRNKREAEALYEFCLNELVYLSSLQPECRKPREEIYKHTLDIYQNALRCDSSSEKPMEDADLIYCHCKNCGGVFLPYDFYGYTNAHAGWYWS